MTIYHKWAILATSEVQVCFITLKSKSYGDYVKITSVKVKTSNTSSDFYKINKCKLQNNLLRACNTIQDLVLANDFEYFFTLTFNTKYDRFNFYQLHKEFKKQLKEIRQSLHINIKYLIVPEQHKNGAWHFHGFFNKEIELLFQKNDYNYDYIEQFKKLGFHNFQKIRDIRRASSYVTKYISKNLGKGIHLNKHSFFCSIGLNRGQEIASKIYNNEFFNLNFFEYRNDYCCKRILTSEEYRRFSSIISRLD